MPNYRRLFVPGGCWFFTVNLMDRNSQLLVDHIDLLHQATQKVQQRLPFDIDAEVVLPNHLHAIWTLPPGDQDFPTRWRLIKTHFSKSLPNLEWRDAARRARGERGIWQRRYWEHLIASEADWSRHVDYCYFNPVKHGWVATVEEWPHSTFHRDMRTGFVPTDWDVAAGERE